MKMKTRMVISTVWYGLLVVFALPARASDGSADLRRFEYKQVHMGVQARVVLYAPDSSTAQRAASAAFDRIAELDDVLSDYRSDSELMRLCARAGTGAIPVSEDLFRVLAVAQDVARRSGGAFDVTIGPIVRLWREARRSERLPHRDSLAHARDRVGWTLVRLDSLARTVTLVARGMRLDLGGIAKGYAADEAVLAMRRAGVRRAMIEFGGDIVAADPPPETTGWRITSGLFGRADDQMDDEISLANEAVSISGDSEQFVAIDGIRYSHVVDPQTGYGLTNRSAALVIAPRGILADALSTMLTALDRHAGRVLLDRWYPEVHAWIITLDHESGG